MMGVCTAMDACTGLKPCENDGECVNILGDYYCNCPNGYGGENCEVEIDGCVNLPCKHNGACTSGAPGEFTCDCQGTGYEGPTCDVNTDDCAAAPCENSGTCVDSVERYTCQCISSAGFSGINCAEPVEPCSFSDRRKCSANAECYMQPIPYSGDSPCLDDPPSWSTPSWYPNPYNERGTHVTHDKNRTSL